MIKKKRFMNNSKFTIEKPDLLTEIKKEKTKKMPNHLLMYNDIPVIKFNNDNFSASIIHKNLLPFSCGKNNNDYSAIKSFAANRIMLMNRKYRKEILDSCLIDDQSDLNICLIGKALSFRDNYWIKKEDSNEKWKDINLYNNPFSEEIAYTALTGETNSVHIGDEIFTGELTSYGTRAKCYEKREDGIYLIKNETINEIFAEVYGTEMARIVDLPTATYTYEKINGLDCSVTKINTNLTKELIPARDILLYTDSKMKMDQPYYQFFMNHDAYNFIKMQLLDYIAINTDRNRDNFGLLKEKGQIKGLFPNYDLDSFFKGKSEDAYYFVTGESFDDTLIILKTKHQEIYKELIPDFLDLYKYINDIEFRNIFETTFGNTNYENLMIRCEDVINFIP